RLGANGESSLGDSSAKSPRNNPLHAPVAQRGDPAVMTAIATGSSIRARHRVRTDEVRDMAWELGAAVLAALVMGAAVVRRSLRARRWRGARAAWLDDIGHYRRVPGQEPRWRA